MGMKRKLCEQEEYFIIVNWETMSSVQIAKELGTSYPTISRMRKRLGLPYKKNVKATTGKAVKKITKVEDYQLSPESIQEIKGRQKTKEFIDSREMIHLADVLKINFSDNPRLNRIIEGEVIQKNDNFITLKTENYVECFKFTDFLTRKAVII